MKNVSLEVRLSSEAKTLIKELFSQGYDLFQMKYAMEDGEYLEKAGISKEVSEEIHFWLSSMGA